MNLYLQMGSNNFHEIRHNENLNLRPLPGTPIDYRSFERDIAEVLKAIGDVPFRLNSDVTVPDAGTPVQSVEWRSSGRRYFLNQRKIASAVRCMFVCYARHKITSKYHTVKVLRLKYEEVEVLTQDDIQGMFMIHNEYLLLNRLKDKDGVYRVHDYFREFYPEEEMKPDTGLVYTGRLRVQLCLVLDYVAPNDIQPECELLNLQQYILNKKVLTELEAARIFKEILLVVKILHSNNIVHRDLKLSNIRFDRKTLKVTLVNFGLGQYLPSVNTVITDQRGSPAYMSPDILTAKPYAPKPSDMWCLGVSFYVMLMGCFPFYDVKSSELFDKIANGSYMIPLCGIERLESVELIKGLLAYNPEVRLKIDDALEKTSRIINGLCAVKLEPMQIVPDLETSEEDAKTEEPEEFRWKFAVLQRGNRFTLRQDPGSQVPILHLTSGEQRIRAIEMKYVRNCINSMLTNGVTQLPSAAGMFDGKPIISKPQPPKVDQVVPEVELEDMEIESFTKVPVIKPNPESKPEPKTAPKPAPNHQTPEPDPKPVPKPDPKPVGATKNPSPQKRLLRSKVSMKNVNIRSLLK